MVQLTIEQRNKIAQLGLPESAVESFDEDEIETLCQTGKVDIFRDKMDFPHLLDVLDKVDAWYGQTDRRCDIKSEASIEMEIDDLVLFVDVENIEPCCETVVYFNVLGEVEEPEYYVDSHAENIKRIEYYQDENELIHYIYE